MFCAHPEPRSDDDFVEHAGIVFKCLKDVRIVFLAPCNRMQSVQCICSVEFIFVHHSF